MPQYGLCWKGAVESLQDGCKSLTEETQSELALRFTNCFLEMSGHETYNCAADVKKNVRGICISNMSDRAFTVYTEFYTHTQNVCFFLRNQIWHEETEKTIDKLSTNSAEVSTKLEKSSEKQEILLAQQEESIQIQERLLNYGDKLTKTLEQSQVSIDNIMNEFRKSTLEQKQLLFDIFDRLSALQSWIVGEVSWLNTIVFYVCSVITIVLITSTKRTANSRVICFILITFYACVERAISTVIIDSNKYEGVEYMQELLVNSVWWSRRIIIAIIALVYTYSTYVYCDYNKMNYELLLNLKLQNELIQKTVEKLTVDDKTEVAYEKIDSFKKRLSNSVDYNYGLNLDDKITSTFDDEFGKKKKVGDKKLFTVDSLLGTKYNLRNASRQGTPTDCF